MNSREHARWARALIKECGGLEESSRILDAAGCHRSTSQLSNYQNPNAEQYMPANVIMLLEADCGRKIYTRAMFEYGGEVSRARDLRDEVCEASEKVVFLQSAVRTATADGKLTPTEADRLLSIHRAAESELREVGEVLKRACN